MLLTRLLLSEGDVGVHQAPSDAAPNKNDIGYQAETVGYTTSHLKLFVLPDVQTEKVSPAEYVVSTKHHPYICHEDILQESYTHLQS